MRRVEEEGNNQPASPNFKGRDEEKRSKEN